MKKALVFYLYGNRNAGDMAICMGTIEYLKEKGYDITMVSRFSEAEDEYLRSKEYVAEYYPDVKVYPGPFSFERDYSKMQKIIAYGKSYLKVLGIIPDERTKKLIKDANIIFFNGGNLLRASSMTDYLRLIGLFYPIGLAHKLGKPIYCLPQSTTKTSLFGKRLLRHYLKCFNTVYIREGASFDILKKNYPRIPFARATDMAFFCEDTELAALNYFALKTEIKEQTIAIVARNTRIGDLGELAQEKQNILKKKLLEFVKMHPDKHYIIVVQTEKDRNFSIEIGQEIIKNADVQLIENHDPLVLREIYKNVDCLVTMRLHAGILALSARTPVFGLFSKEWGLKNPGIMRDYDMPFIMIEDGGEKISAPENNKKNKTDISKHIIEFSKQINIH